MIAAGVLGLAALALLATQRDLDGARVRPHAAARVGGGLGADVALLTSWPIMMCFAFFSLYAITLVGFQTFATTALAQLYSVPLLVATSGLTGFLLGGVAGILAGGFIAGTRPAPLEHVARMIVRAASHS